MTFDFRLRALFALLAAMVLAVGVAACGDDDDDDGGDDTGGEESALIESNPDNEGVELTIGSKNFDEQFILGEIYAQALEAAGYTVNTELNLGSEVIAKKALEQGEIDAYPEYTSTTLTSLYKVAPEDVPGDATEAYELANAELEADGLTAFPPTPFTSANAVGLLTETADELGVATISDLEGVSQDLVLYGTTECRQRIDCLLGPRGELRARVQGLQVGRPRAALRGARQRRRRPVDPVHDRRPAVRRSGRRTRSSRTTSSCCPRAT